MSESTFLLSYFTTSFSENSKEVCMKRKDINYVKLSASRFEHMLRRENELINILDRTNMELIDLQDAVEKFVDDLCKKSAEENDYGYTFIKVDEVVHELGDLVGYIRDENKEEEIRQATKKRQAKDKADELEKEAEKIRKDAEE